MARSTKSKPITKESVSKALAAGATSLTQVARALGFKGSVGSATTRKIREAVPDIDARIEANKAAGKAKPESSKAAKADRKPKAGRKPKAYPRAEHSPFREGSAYAACYDILAAHPNGIERAKLVDQLARLMPRKEGESDEARRRRAYFNVTVVASSREDGRSHRCIQRAADSFFVERTNGGWLRLRLRSRRF